jgi:hypothetical protein
MSDFLAFLNSADVETLTQTPGVTRPLAESLMAARPFASEEDCLQVRGMGKGLLARLQSAFEAQENDGEGRALVPVQEEAAPALVVVESRPEDKSNARAQESFWSRLGRASLYIFRAVLRFVLLVIVIGGIGAAIYFGVPYLRDKFIVPVEQNRAQVEELQSEMRDSQNRIAALEAQFNETNGRVAALETAIEAHSASLAKLAGMQSALEQKMQAGDAALLAELTREIRLTRAIEYLSRARLYLSQSNFGLARTDVQAARDLLAEVQANEPEFKTESLKQVITRLDLALGNLPAFPVVAVGDVDIALQLLLSDLPEGAAEATVTPTPQMEATPPPTPIIAPESSPTPTAVP